MMGHKEHIKNLAEWDALVANNKYYFRPGVRSKAKRRFNKRIRRVGVADIRESAYSG